MKLEASPPGRSCLDCICSWRSWFSGEMTSWELPSTHWVPSAGHGCCILTLTWSASAHLCSQPQHALSSWRGVGRSWKTTPSPTLQMVEARGGGRSAMSTLLFRGWVFVLSDLLVGRGGSSSLAYQMAFCFASLIPFYCFYNYESNTWSLKIQAVSMYIVCVYIYISLYIYCTL